MYQCIIIQTTVPTQYNYHPLCDHLILQKLAACIHIQPSIKSIYCWEDNLESSNEIIIQIKTAATNFDTISTLIKEKHPYDVPEIISIPILSMEDHYKDWFIDQMN